MLHAVKSQTVQSLIKSKSACLASQGTNLKPVNNSFSTTQQAGLSNTNSHPHQKSCHRAVVPKATSSFLHKSSSTSSLQQSSKSHHVVLNLQHDTSSDSSLSSQHSPYKIVKSAMVPSKLVQCSNVVAKSALPSISLKTPEKVPVSLPSHVSSLKTDSKKASATKMIPSTSQVSANVANSTTTDAKKYSFELDEIVKRKKALQTLVVHGRERLKQSDRLMQSLRQKNTETKGLTIDKVSHTVDKSKISKHPAVSHKSVAQTSNIRVQPTVCFKSKHKLVKKSQEHRSTANLKSVIKNVRVSRPESTQEQTGAQQSPYKLVKNAKVELIRTAQPAGSKTVKPIFSGHPSPSIHVQSRYKLVKKAIETVHRKGRERKNSGGSGQQNVQLKSRYKLVKKVIETAHRKERARRNSGGKGDQTLQQQSRYKLVKKSVETGHRRERRFNGQHKRDDQKYPKPKKTRFAIVKDKTELSRASE